MLKKLAIIVVFFIVVASVAGCTSPTTTSNSQGLGHNAVLEKLVDAFKRETYGNGSQTVQAWQVVWNNDTSVTIFTTLRWGGGNNTKTNTVTVNSTVTANATMLAFPTTQDATNYLNAFDKSNYLLKSTDYKTDTSGSTGINDYNKATGHYPSTYQYWTYTNGNIFGGSLNVHSITQYDNILEFVKVNMML